MKEFAILVWNMPASDFLMVAAGAIALFITFRYISTELQIARMKRIAKFQR